MGDGLASSQGLAEAFDDAAIVLQASVEAICSTQRSWPGKVTAVIYGVLEFLASDVEQARLLLVDWLDVGPYGVLRRDRLIEYFATLLATGREQCAGGQEELPRLTERALAGGLAWAIASEIRAGSSSDLRELLPQLVELSLMPYLGHECARRWGRCSAQALDELRSSRV